MSFFEKFKKQMYIFTYMYILHYSQLFTWKIKKKMIRLNKTQIFYMLEKLLNHAISTYVLNLVYYDMHSTSITSTNENH